MSTLLRVLQLLLPVARVLVGIYFPKLRIPLEELWQHVEDTIRDQLEKMQQQPSKHAVTAMKVDLFNEGARDILEDNDLPASNGLINLVREVTHTRMSAT